MLSEWHRARIVRMFQHKSHFHKWIHLSSQTREGGVLKGLICMICNEVYLQCTSISSDFK